MTIYDMLDKLSTISLDNDAFNSYKKLIESNYQNLKQDDYQNHHILPKSIFPEYKNLSIYKCNSVYLSFKNHLEAHRLLALITNDIKMKHAYFKMSNIDKKYNDKYALQCKNDYVNHLKNTIPVIDKDGNRFRVNRTDPRYISGELVGRRKNKVYVVDKNGKKFFVDKNDPRYLSGELVGHTKKMIAVKHSITGKTCNMSKNDPRYLSGEYVGVTKGMVQYNNGIVTKRFFPGSEDEGFILGQLKIERPKRNHSEETKKKISKSHKGKPKHSDEQKKKWSEMRKGKRMYNNGVKNILCYPDSVPNNFVIGKLIKKR